ESLLGVPTIWQTARHGRSIAFCLPQSGRIPAGVVWQVNAYLAGFDLKRADPAPAELGRVARLPPIGSQLALGRGPVTYLHWTLGPGTKSAKVPLCAAPAAGQSTASGLRIE